MLSRRPKEDARFAGLLFLIADGKDGKDGKDGRTVVEVAGSHAVYVSQPAAVADLIVQAAKEAIAHVPGWPGGAEPKAAFTTQSG